MTTLESDRKLLEAEAPLSGVLRVLNVELACVRSILARRASATLLDAEVHRLRTLTKSSRAHWRLLRDAVARDAFVDFDAQLSGLARSVASRREAAVRQLAFSKLAEQASLTPEVVRQLTPLLEGGRQAPNEPGASVELVLPRVVLPVKGQGALLRQALKRGYRAARRKLELAEGKVAGAGPLHDFRKRVKAHLHQLLILRADAWLQSRCERLDVLGDLLGAHQDLADLERYFETLQGGQLPGPGMAKAIGHVLVASEQQRVVLSARAVQLGRALFARKPHRAASKIARHSASVCG